MDPDDLRRRTTPEGLAPLPAAMWHAQRGDWERAHEIAQAVETRDGAWVHGYLHRQEGDLANADYWYRRAGRRRSDLSLAAEWEDIVGAL
ncbi:hypothetical protein [Muricoccus radiodurans]|uniref:hypothetical protein n=1 Tax=Muricoccus radiodurans TaxID=2231721 RepID=UPI003CE97F8C